MILCLEGNEQTELDFIQFLKLFIMLNVKRLSQELSLIIGGSEQMRP